MVLMLFTASVIGVNLSLHYCVDHKIENISLYSKAECPCQSKHSAHHASHCEDAHNNCEDAHNNNYSDQCCEDNCSINIDCCSEQDVEIQINDAFSASMFKYHFEVAEQFVIDYQQILHSNETKVCSEKEKIHLPDINERYIHPLAHIYSSNSDDESDSIA